MVLTEGITILSFEIFSHKYDCRKKKKSVMSRLGLGFKKGTENG